MEADFSAKSCETDRARTPTRRATDSCHKIAAGPTGTRLVTDTCEAKCNCGWDNTS